MLGGSAEDEQSGRHEDSQERRTTGVHSYLHVETTGEQIYNIEKTTFLYFAVQFLHESLKYIWHPLENATMESIANNQS